MAKKSSNGSPSTYLMFSTAAGIATFSAWPSVLLLFWLPLVLAVLFWLAVTDEASPSAAAFLVAGRPRGMMKLQEKSRENTRIYFSRMFFFPGKNVPHLPGSEETEERRQKNGDELWDAGRALRRWRSLAWKTEMLQRKFWSWAPQRIRKWRLTERRRERRARNVRCAPACNVRCALVYGELADTETISLNTKFPHHSLHMTMTDYVTTYT